MDVNEASRREQRVLASALRAYERGRARWALGVAVPLLVLPLSSWLLGGHPVLMCLLGAALFAAAALLLWRGQGWARGVGLGVVAGLLPYGLAHASRLSGHVCTEAICFSICLGASVLGGIAAGIVVSSATRRRAHPAQAFAAATGIAFLTGALGCGCIGALGVAGLAAGLGASLCVAHLLTRAREAEPPEARP